MKIISCPQCQTSLSVTEEMAGKKVRCPKCTTVFDVPGEASAPMAAPIPPPLPMADPLPSSITSEPGPAPRPRQDSYREEGHREEGGSEEGYRLEGYREESRREDRRRNDDDDRPRGRGARWGDEDEEEDDYRRRDDVGRRGSSKSGWQTVRTGLNLMFIGLLIIVIAAVVIGVFAVGLGVAMFGGARGGRPGENIAIGAIMLMCVGGLAVLGAGLTYLIGYVMCVTSPDERAKNLMVGSLICFGLAFFVGLVQGGVGAAMNPGMGQGGMAPGPAPNLGVSLAVTILQQALSLASGVLQILFMKRVCEVFSNHRLASNCWAFLIFYIVMSAAVVIANAAMLIFFGSLLIGGPNPFAGLEKAAGAILAVFGFLGLIYLVWLVWFLVLLARVRDTIGQASAKSAFDPRAY